MKKLLHFVNPVYNVNILQSENGSVSASLTNLAGAGFASLEDAEAWDGSPF